VSLSIFPSHGKASIVWSASRSHGRLMVGLTDKTLGYHAGIFWNSMREQS
jgi:hypothetical protein